MTVYNDIDQFVDISIYDITDPVIGGPTGASNDPLQKLSDRTRYLFNRLGRRDIRIITGAASITPADRFKLIKVNAAANITISLDAVASFPVGMEIPFKIKCPVAKAVTIAPAAGSIEDGNKTWAPLWACDGDEFKLVAVDTDADNTADLWMLVDAKGNFEIAGTDGLVRVQPRNSFIAQGEIKDRADFPRLWDAVSAGAIADATWNSDIRYKQFFSTGNSTTTFRFPDMRSMVWKGLDLGRGLSLGRLDNVAGGLELDAVLEHYHNTTFNPNADNQTGSGRLVVGNQLNEGVPPVYKSGGAINAGNAAIGNTENLIKTTGFIPVIYY